MQAGRAPGTEKGFLLCSQGAAFRAAGEARAEALERYRPVTAPFTISASPASASSSGHEVLAGHSAPRYPAVAIIARFLSRRAE